MTRQKFWAEEDEGPVYELVSWEICGRATRSRAPQALLDLREPLLQNLHPAR
jgi:hypothetical protein